MGDRWPAWSGIVLIAASLMGHDADAQERHSEQSRQSCFEVVIPPSSVHPRRPMRVNKCTGETWILVADRRTARKGNRPVRYRWARLEVQGAAGDKAATAAPGSAQAAQSTCFEFVGRRFCE